MSVRTVASLAGALSLSLLAAVAQANTITIDDSGITRAGTDSTITCNGATANQCALISGANPTGSLPNSNPTTEVNYLAGLLGVSAASLGTPSSSPEDPSPTFVTSAPYFILKYNGVWAFFRNLNGALTVNTSGLTRGLSHYTVVPLPGAALLFLTALGGLVGWRRWSSQGEGSAPQIA
jgi:hypothetical protein